MNKLLDKLLFLIEDRNALHSKKIKETQQQFDSKYFVQAESFLQKYMKILQDENKDLEYAVDCYFKMLEDFMYAQVDFFKTGKYMNTSFDQVNKEFYNNPEKNEYYMHGLLLSQFLWFHHYGIFAFFANNLNKYDTKDGSYLEIGGGHGLYISEAMDILTNFEMFDLVDISETSIALSKKMNAGKNIQYITKDVFDYHPNKKYSFISMCEVLEHVENPLELLKILKSLLKDDGVVYITTPTNAPTIDHIYLFNNKDEIVELIDKAGFNIIDEIEVPAENISVEKAHKNKVCVMYGAFLKLK